MSPSIPWCTTHLTWICLFCPLPVWSHKYSSTRLIMSPNHMGLCCLATSMENGYHRGVITGALNDFFSWFNSGHNAACSIWVDLWCQILIYTIMLPSCHYPHLCINHWCHFSDFIDLKLDNFKRHQYSHDRFFTPSQLGSRKQVGSICLTLRPSHYRFPLHGVFSPERLSKTHWSLLTSSVRLSSSHGKDATSLTCTLCNPVIYSFL